MSLLRSLLPSILASAALPALVGAADPDMMRLVMPDAATVMEIKVSSIMASPIGSVIKDGIRQGIASQMDGKMSQAKPEIREQIALLAGIDWSQQVQDVVVARGKGKEPPTLIIVRSPMDVGGVQALKGFGGDRSDYEGVPVLVSAKPKDGAIAFLDNSIVLLGQLAEVKAAIHRRGQPVALPKVLAAQVARYNRDDIWVASTEIISGPIQVPASAKSPATAQVSQFLEKIAGFNGGLRFSPDFDLTADLEARTDKNAQELAGGMRMLTSMAQAQARGAGQSGSGLDAFKFQLSGRHILISLHVPEAQVLAGMQRIRAAQAAQASTGGPRVRVENAPAAAPSSGLAAPPPGTIRVQSSEMGTVLIPVGKQPQ